MHVVLIIPLRLVSDMKEPDEYRDGKKLRKSGGLLLWLFFMVIVLLLVLYFVIGQTKVRSVSVSGSEHYTNEQIIQAMGLDQNTTILDVFMNNLVSPDTLPYIDDYEVTYESFNSIGIRVDEKEVISYMPYQDEYLALDKEGYIVGYEKEKLIDRPIIEGLYFESARLGDKIDIETEILEAILSFYHLGKKYQIFLDGLSFPQGDDQLIYGYAGEIVIIFGDASELDRKVKDVSAVLPKLDKGIPGTLDLQQASDRYIFKETVGALYYLPYGERYLAVDVLHYVKKISVHRMMDVPLVTGAVVHESQVGERVAMDGEFTDALDQVFRCIAEHGVEVDVIDFGDGELTNITLSIGQVDLKLESLDSLDNKILSAKAVLSTLNKDANGYIQLDSDLESYEFVGD